MEEREMTWEELNYNIDKLEREQRHLEHLSDRTTEESNRYEYLFGIIRQLNEIRDEHSKNDPSPNGIVTIKKETRLNGYYTRNGRSHSPEIVLLMETLGAIT